MSRDEHRDRDEILRTETNEQKEDNIFSARDLVLRDNGVRIRKKRLTFSFETTDFESRTKGYNIFFVRDLVHRDNAVRIHLQN